MPTFQDHFADHAASSFARQMALGDVIGERAWSLDVQKGLLRFGDDQEYRVQLLGSHAFEPGTWLWIWANAQSDIPPQHTQAALRIQQLGEAQGIGAFTEASVQLGDVTDHMIAITCSGLEGGRCFYRAPYDGGALFMLLEDAPAQVLAPVPLARVNTVLMEVVSQFEVDHRRLVTSFFQQQGLDATATESGGIRATRAGEGHIEINFDALGRMSKVTGTLTPAAAQEAPVQAAPKKPRWQFWK
ncbi:hypothetical protein VLK31_09375 [Variovorax sp. H27-G14]|uniref:DUF6882 domain-containing protein n=1 Tax=Variovorax sp. H27-G14 TaxID=3111914 RepID=UPI0038FCDDE1